MLRLCVIVALLVAAHALPQERSIPSVKTLGRHRGARIVGGRPAERGQFPFSALINSNGYVCGGALVSQRYVLTIAQCVDGLTNWEVYLGAGDLAATEPGRTVVTTVRGLKYPGYDAELTGLTSDIGLIDLSVEVPLSEYVQPAKLPARSQIGKVFLGQEATFVAFGPTTAFTEDFSDYSLNYATLRVIDDGDEGWAMRAKGDNGESACDDYGSPLVLYSDDGTPRVIGVNTFIAGGDGCHNAVSGFTVVSLYLDWISSETGVEIDQLPA